MGNDTSRILAALKKTPLITQAKASAPQNRIKLNAKTLLDEISSSQIFTGFQVMFLQMLLLFIKAAALAENESERLKALHEYRILGTSPEQSYDDITTIASETCHTPIALLSLVDADRQWFKSRVGLEADETPRDWSFCAHAILSPEPLIVQDALSDDRFRDNPLVKGDPKIRLYAGFPLQNHEDHRIGTLCVIDREPRDLSASQCKIMEALARQAVAFLELRKRSIRLLDSVSQIESRNGMISTCSYCRKAKDDRGLWMHLDQYLSQRTSLSFSHGICDSCMEEHFPEVAEVWKQERSSQS